MELQPEVNEVIQRMIVRELVRAIDVITSWLESEAVPRLDGYNGLEDMAVSASEACEQLRELSETLRRWEQSKNS